MDPDPGSQTNADPCGKKKFTALGPGSSCTKTVRNAFDAGKSITWASKMGLSPENLNFFRLTWQAGLTARCNFTGHKKVSISRVQPPPTCPRNGFARIKSTSYGAIWMIGPYSYYTSLLCWMSLLSNSELCRSLNARTASEYWQPAARALCSRTSHSQMNSVTLRDLST